MVLGSVDMLKYYDRYADDRSLRCGRLYSGDLWVLWRKHVQIGIGG